MYDRSHCLLDVNASNKSLCTAMENWQGVIIFHVVIIFSYILHAQHARMMAAHTNLSSGILPLLFSTLRDE